MASMFTWAASGLRLPNFFITASLMPSRGRCSSAAMTPKATMFLVRGTFISSAAIFLKGTAISSAPSSAAIGNSSGGVLSASS